MVFDSNTIERKIPVEGNEIESVKSLLLHELKN